MQMMEMSEEAAARPESLSRRGVDLRKLLASPPQLRYSPTLQLHNESSSSLSSLGATGSQCCRGVFIRFGGEECP